MNYLYGLTGQRVHVLDAVQSLMVSFVKAMPSSPPPQQSQHFPLIASLKLLGLRLAFSIGESRSIGIPAAIIAAFFSLAIAKAVLASIV